MGVPMVASELSNRVVVPLSNEELRRLDAVKRVYGVSRAAQLRTLVINRLEEEFPNVPMAAESEPPKKKRA